MERSSGIFKRVDWGIILIYSLLVIFGWINIYAAVYNEDYGVIFDISQRYGKQFLWISISILLIIIIFIIDARAYEFLSYPIFIFALLLLVAVLLFGKEVNGARSWFEFGGIRLQPAEFTKVATALAVSRFMSVHDFRINRMTDLIKVAALIFLPAALIILQNDTGSALVYIAFVIVLYREGLSPWYLILGFIFILLFIGSLLASLYAVFFVLPILAILVFHFMYRNIRMTMIGIVMLVLLVLLLVINGYFFHYDKLKILVTGILVSLVILAYPAFVKRIKHYWLIAAVLVAAMAFTFSVEYIFNNVLEKHQRTRINVVLGLEDDPKGVGYNINQSKIAIGSGGFSGKGFLQGTQTKFDFVPEQDTDFIYCTVGEEWGFLGTSMVLILFGALLIRIVVLAERQRSKMNRIYGYCVASILFFHVAVNVGMTIGLTPVIGIPLPFFSYGGSSLWSFTILLFILLRLDTTRMDNF
ncbi:MAG: rod shape-determining protein RodA [Bacteroidales bacterium]|nr:rod shape-determining protein RodA [Bacteroidales bacterium]